MNVNWRKFFKGEPVENGIAPVIYRSWQRSVGYNVNHTEISQNMILTTSQLRELKDSQEDIIRAAESVLPYLYKLLQSTNYTVLLGEKKGFVIEALGDGPFLTKAQKIHLSPGANWREDIKGTNAIGTALTENCPITVSGCEHFVQENHFMSCWAVPIHGLQGEIIGFIDISGETGNHQEHIIEIAFLGAKWIEQNLRSLDIERQLKFYREGAKLAIGLLKEGFISIDRFGVITNINSSGALLLGRKRKDIIGKPVAEVFSASKGWMFNNQELDLHLKNRSGDEISSCLRRVTDESGKFLGAFGTVQLTESQTEAPIWVGSSPSSQRILERVDKAASTPSSILLQGESGTGKEIVARMIHDSSSFRHGPFVALNCAALPSSLLESELFGYADGAFTGSRRGGQPGKFELAHQGTIFLDEIGDMPLTAQVAFLRVLQEKEITRIGSTKPHKVDVRIIAATHKDLKSLVEAQTFRLDLYYRLKVITIELTPLRERLEDIKDLVPYFIQKSCALNRLPCYGIEDNVYPYLYAYSWPGNVRELENCIQGMIAMANSHVLTIDDLPLELRLTPDSKNIESPSLLDQQTKQTIVDALAQTHGKIAPAAQLLGIGRNTLYRKMKKYNISGN
ncbi:MAG TPA: sigma-54-dependent Fis family transcriptional regulator [Desulfitobacterium dehalogenans]|uniref:Sigma-54-dependent Fis family transcriptional regulator n=1 Tax=Desulfitobacterium dehalogenans TaxID=36854 RepID=A0A7C7D8R0_9FIRM|nr:sigma-54-dependent Fis family transcriptional regulator [Desulfitobacterium dehalogenans]